MSSLFFVLVIETLIHLFYQDKILLMPNITVLENQILQLLNVPSIEINNVQAFLQEGAPAAGGFDVPNLAATNLALQSATSPQSINTQTDQIAKVVFKWQQISAETTAPIKYICKVMVEQIGGSDPVVDPGIFAFIEKTTGTGAGETNYEEEVLILHTGTGNNMSAGIYRIFASFSVDTTNDAVLDPAQKDQTVLSGFINLGTIDYYAAL